MKALRIYDEMGLIKPAFVDRFTEYRYYSADQVPRLNRVLALKDLGFSLEQIKSLLDEPHSSARFYQMLQLKQAEVSQLLSDEQARLQRIEARLKALNVAREITHTEKPMSHNQIEIKKVEPQLVASAREVVPNFERLSPTFYRLYDQVFGHLMFRHGLSIKDFGAATAIYHSWDPYLEVEAAIPINKAVPSVEHAKVYTLAGIEQAASTIHTGALTTLGLGYEAITKWIETNGYRIVGPSREINLVFMKDGDPNQCVTELQFPVTRP